jgi:hypothetical protein
MIEYEIVPPTLLSLEIEDLVSGYDRLRDASVELRRKWREPILAIYAHQRSQFESELKRYQKKIKRRKTLLNFSIIAISLTITTGLLLLLSALVLKIPSNYLSTFLCASPILCFFGTGLAIVFTGLSGYLPTPLPPKPPINPLDENAGFFSDLLSEWRKGLQGQLLIKNPDDGYVGEKLFLQEIQKLDLHGYILHRLVQKTGDDIDLVLICNKGIWLFEVKYWSGTIIHEQGQWHQEKHYYLKGGVGQIDHRQVTQPPDVQWKRMRDELIYTLKRHAPQLVKKTRELTNVFGGVVFTHPSADIEIPKGAGFNWGNIPFWIETIKNSRDLGEFSNERFTLVITEIILNRHQSLENNATQRSMLSFAEQLIDKENKKIEDWILNQSQLMNKPLVSDRTYEQSN